MPFWSRFADMPGGRLPECPAADAVAQLHASGVLEPAFVRWRPGGLEWWAGAHAQRVAVTLPATLEGLHVARILLEADVCSHLPEGPEAERRLDVLNQRASLSALMRRPDGRVVWAASLLAHEKNAAWTARMLPAVFALQAAEAPAAAEALAPVGGRPAHSAHPEAGPRARSLEQIGRWTAAVLTRAPAPDLDTRVFADVAATLREAGLVARDDGRGLDVEVPFAGETALLQLLGPMRHPALGEGVLCLAVAPLLSLHAMHEGMEAAALLASLNAQAWHMGFDAESLPALGGWAPDPNSGNPALATFLPATLAHDETVTDLAMAQLARVLLLARVLDDPPAGPEALRRAVCQAI